MGRGCGKASNKAPLSSQAGLKSITSFFSPKSKPAAQPETTPTRVSETLSKESMINNDDAHTVTTPLPSKPETALSETSSSNLKTRSKLRSPRDKNSDVERKDDCEDPDHWGKIARKINTDEEAGCMSDPPIQPAVGALVEILFDGGKWYRGQLTSQDKSGSWHVKFSDGDETDVTFPDPEVRLISATETPRPKRAAVSTRKRLAPDSSEDEMSDKPVESPPTAKASSPKKARRSRVRPAVSASESDADEEYRMEEGTSSESDDDDAEAERSESDVSDSPPRRGGKTARKSKSASRPRKDAADVGKAIGAASTPKAAPSVSGKLAPTPGSRAAGSTAASAPAPRSVDRHIVSEQKKEKVAKFEVKNQERCAARFRSPPSTAEAVSRSYFALSAPAVIVIGQLP
jgi:hypothetical protein